MHSILVWAALLVAPGIALQQGFCRKLKQTVDDTGCQTAAVSFCSSYISISARTATSTVTPTSTHVTTVTSTITAGGKKGMRTTATVSVTKTTTATSTDIVTKLKTTGRTTIKSNAKCAAPTTIAKRAVATPSCLKGYPAPQTLSSACSCLAIRPTTLTTTVTAKNTATVSSTKTVTTKTRLPPNRTFTKSKTISETTKTTTTSTTTISIQATVTAGVSGAAPDSFYLVDSADGDYGVTTIDTLGRTVIAFTANAPGSATVFSLNGTDLIADGLYVGNQDPTASPVNPQLVVFTQPGSVDILGKTNIICTFHPSAKSSCTLECNGVSGTVDSFPVLTKLWTLGSTPAALGTRFTPIVVAA